MPAEATKRIEDCTATLADAGCAPTFPTPGSIVQRYPQFVRYLQDSGAEIAVHGYQHVDLQAYPPAEASEQLARAAQVFARHGIGAYGFRCPYLSCSDELLDALPKGLFEYSSNQAICWDETASGDASNTSTIFDTLRRFYQPRSAQEAVSVPWIRAGMVEIPVCVPDDLQLHDGLGLGSEGIALRWRQTLNQTHRRGELFGLLFHPELASLCKPSFVAVLREARQLQPRVWIARLRDISNWWREKSNFAVDVTETGASLRLSFLCTERATILVKGLEMCGAVHAWDGSYHQLKATTVEIPAEPRPFVGLPAQTPEHIATFLQEQGYILDTAESAVHCGIYVNDVTLARLADEVQLVNYIEAAKGPLIRYWRWPGGAKSAMSVSGDLDALTLLDYASRLFAR